MRIFIENGDYAINFAVNKTGYETGDRTDIMVVSDKGEQGALKIKGLSQAINPFIKNEILRQSQDDLIGSF